MSAVNSTCSTRAIVSGMERMSGIIRQINWGSSVLAQNLCSLKATLLQLTEPSYAPLNGPEANRSERGATIGHIIKVHTCNTPNGCTCLLPCAVS